MRRLPLLLVAVPALLAVSCYPYIVPQGPVISAPTEHLGAPAPSGATYAAERQVDLPVLPFRLWGLYFEEEVLFELADHPVYAMVEITRAFTRDGEEAWFALVSERTGLQHVVVGTAEAMVLAETFPAPFHDGRLRVIRLEGDGAVEYDAAFHLPNGELLQATVTAKRPGEPPPNRNGNAMNHSADRVLAVLDLEEFNWAKAAVFVEGQRARVRLLAPFLPFAWRLQQTAGGLSWGGVSSEPGQGETALVATLDDVATPILFRLERHGELLHLVGADRVTDHIYRFRPLGDGLDGPIELVGAEVRHGDVSVFDVEFNPPLPDLRWLPEGEHRSAMVAGSNGQAGYMIGRVEVRAEEGRALVDVLPAHPFWACERPLRGRIQYRDDAVRLRAEIAPELAADGAGRDACFELDRAFQKER
jgi:hypothetical protein